MAKINHLIIVLFVTIFTLNEPAEANVLRRTRRQSDDGNGEIIDNIFNIPITAIRQTAAAAQSIYPEGGSSIDTVFNIPVATLEAVSSLVKTRNSQRRQMDAAEAQKRRKERRDRLQAHRQGQRLQHNDPLGVNALTDLLVGNHGLFSGHGLWGGHHDFIGDHLSNNLGSHLISHFGGHGGSSSHDHGDGDGDSDDHDSVGDYQDGSTSNGSNNNGYEVTEEIDEDRSGWASWLNFGNFFGGSPSSKPKNKIAPRPTDRRKYGRYDDGKDAPLENKVAPKNSRYGYRRSETERPLENKIAPKNQGRYNYRGNSYDEEPIQDRVAPRRGYGRSRDRYSNDRLVFEHRSL